MRVYIVELMRIKIKRPIRNQEFDYHELYATIGVTHDDICFDHGTMLFFPALEERGEGWKCMEIAVAGQGRIHLPECNHADFLNLRPPENGELFDSATHLLWLTPSRIVQIEGEFALALLAERHGEVIEDLDEFLRMQLFDSVIENVLASGDLEIDGEVGREIIDRVCGIVDDAHVLTMAKADVASMAKSILDVLDFGNAKP